MKLPLRQLLATAALLVVTACGSVPNSPSAFPATASGVPVSSTVGYVGCSNTWMAVDGYHQGHGVGNFWPTLQQYGGGSVDLWAQGNRYWQVFDDEQAQQPVAAVWWHVCMHPGTTQDEIDSVFQGIRSRVGAQVPIFASSMAIYQNDGECSMADPAGSERFVENLMSRGLVQRGPTLTPLNYDNTAADGCHPSASTRLLDGDVLYSSFG